VYDPEGGAKCSEEAMKIYFGNDLAFQRKYHPLLVDNINENKS
jgi:hypothetical protein